MDKLRIKVATRVLEKVKTQFPETVKFINDSLEQDCRKENMSVNEVIFFTFLKTKSQRRKTLFILWF